MAQYRQSGIDRLAVRSNQDLHHYHHGNGGSNSSDHVSIGVRPTHKQTRQRRSARFDKNRRCCCDSIGPVVLILSLIFIAAVFMFNYFSGGSKDINNDEAQDDDLRNDVDFLTNVTRTKNYKVLKFGKGSVAHGGDSRYWERDDRRRDEDYTEDESEHSVLTDDGSTKKGRVRAKVKHQEGSNKSVGGLYNEAGRDELKTYEAEYEASLKNVGQSRKDHGDEDQQSDDVDGKMQKKEATGDDEYDDGIDSHDSRMEEYDDTGHESGDESDVENTHHEDGTESDIGIVNGNIEKDGREASTDSFEEISLSSHQNTGDVNSTVRDVTVVDGHSTKKSGSDEKRSSSRKKAKRRKFSGNSCEMKYLNSTAQIVEPPASRKFARFSLHYTKQEDRPKGQEDWEPSFAGHQSLHEREESFIARDQMINCGFVKGPKGSPSTGFELAEDDAKIMSSCHIVVISCIFGNSDRLRSPTGKTVTRLSRKNVCFVMFVDEVTLQTLSSEGQTPDRMGFIGLWKIVVVKNLPYNDMRRVGKIPKLLPHRLFPSARYSIWLDSKLRLQLDPILILEYFLWRKDHEYAISNHYDRHCVWEEVAQNKKLNKYNHTVIDQQFAFYQADGLKRFNASDPHKLLPSNVPEGSFIVRAHTPMSNLFSCLWFNEVERFTPRDQLSFAYTYHKLRRKNPGKPFHLNMFKDCERRAIAKLFRHRSEEKRNIPQQETE